MFTTKKLAVVLLVLVAQVIFGQEKDSLKYDSTFRIQAFQPIHFGNNSLSKAHDSDFGFGVSAKIFKYNNFRFYVGGEIANYNVTDSIMLGKVERSRYTSVYTSVSYAVPINKSFTFVPDVGIGYVKLSQRTNGTKFGFQEGTEYRLGGMIDYGIDRTIAVYIGIHYIYTNLRINTSPEYEKFFGRSNQLQLAIGLNFK